MVPWQSIQGFSGATAVGSLVFAAWALITNAFATNLFPVIDIFAQSPAWAIVVALPVVSLTYLVGLLCINASEAFLARFRFVAPESQDDSRLHVLDKSAATATRYEQIRQEAAVLAGSGTAVALLALGAALHAARLPGWRRSLVSMTIIATVVAVASYGLAIHRRRKASLLLCGIESGRPG